jgi:hypothetical protein
MTTTMNSRQTVCHCGKPECAKGLCKIHYEQSRRDLYARRDDLLAVQHKRIVALETLLGQCAVLLGEAMPPYAVRCSRCGRGRNLRAVADDG